MKTFLASLLLLVTIALICSPLYIVWLGAVSAAIPTWGRIVMVIAGLLLCRLVKPVSILTGKDYKFF